MQVNSTFRTVILGGFSL